MECGLLFFNSYVIDSYVLVHSLTLGIHLIRSVGMTLINSVGGKILALKRSTFVLILKGYE